MKRWIALWTVVAVLVGCDSEPALLRQMRIERLISALRGAILESVEAEKSAVLATTDEESQAMARETEKFAADINQLRGELRPLIIADGRKEEIDRLDAFDTAWKELEGVDQRLLALAVANTNLKATRLSAVEGQAALDHLTGILVEMQRTATQPETIRVLAQPGVAAYRVQSLLMVHISSAEDAEMTRLEQQIAALSDEVDRSLAECATAVRSRRVSMATRVERLSTRCRRGAVAVAREHQRDLVRRFDPREAPRNEGLSQRARQTGQRRRVAHQSNPINPWDRGRPARCCSRGSTAPLAP
jgi:hypothetical protein